MGFVKLKFDVRTEFYLDSMKKFREMIDLVFSRYNRIDTNLQTFGNPAFSMETTYD